MGKQLTIINNISYLQFEVGNAKQAAAYFQKVFGFTPVAYAGLETGNTHAATYVVEQGDIRFAFTSPNSKRPRSDAAASIADRLSYHGGDGIRDIALSVDNAVYAYRIAPRRGAESAYAPIKNGGVTMAGIRTAGDTIHSFVQDNRIGERISLPGFANYREFFGNGDSEGVGLKTIDHVVQNVEKGKMLMWVQRYKEIFGFKEVWTVDDQDIYTEYSALMSVVMGSGNRTILFPINEPATGKRKGNSQIQEYLDFYNGPGVQHIAMSTDDIIKTVRDLHARGVEFLKIPESYYDLSDPRFKGISENINELKELGILVDRDEHGYMLQLFTKPLGPYPTLFLEIIQRKGAQSFGKSNFKALFEAIERGQQDRGTLIAPEAVVHKPTAPTWWGVPE